MSRSFKHQPFQSACSNSSAKRDKIHAHRGERRSHSRALRQALRLQDFEDFLLPHKLECPGNEVYDWCIDGNQRYCGLTEVDWADYIKALYDPDYIWYGDYHYTIWPPMWYSDMMRK